MDPISRAEPLLFIDSTPSKAQSTAIRSHVHGTHRRWNKLRRVRPNTRAKELHSKTNCTIVISDKGESEDAIDHRRPSTVGVQNSNKNQSPNPGAQLYHFLGNTDPFKCAAIEVTPYVCEGIRLAERFHVFRTWAALHSEEVRQRLFDRHQSHLRLAIGDAANLHVLLAAGACVKSDHVAALWHKTKAISLFRHQVPGPVITYYTIRLLMSLEAFAGELATARVHHRAAVRFIACHHELERTSIDPLPISDVWLAIHSFQRTEMNVDDWDPGLRSAGLLASYPMIPCSELQDLMKGAHEIATTLAQGVRSYEDVMWTTMRSAAVSGRLNNRLLDHYEFQSCMTCDPFPIAVTMALSCAMHVLFTTDSYTSKQRAWYFPFRYLLRRVDMGLDRSLLLWLHFMCAVSDRLLESGSNWAWQEYKVLQRDAGVSDRGIREILRRFVYTDEMERVLHSRAISLL